MDSVIRIPHVAEELDVSPQYLRILEWRGVIPPARRDFNGRLYSAFDIALLRAMGVGTRGAPNALSERLKRLAPALREVGIEYGEGRGGSKGTRLKTLTKKDPAKDRRQRQDRQPYEEVLQNGQKAADDADDPTDDADDPPTKHRQHESPANSGVADDSDGADDVMRPGSKQDHWHDNPMRSYRRGGAA